MNRNCDFLMTCSVDDFKNWLNKYNINKNKIIVNNNKQVLFIEFSISIYDQEASTVRAFIGSFEKILKDLRDTINSLPREIQIFQDNDINILQFIDDLDDLDFATGNMCNFIRTMIDFSDIDEQPQGTA